MSHSVQPNIHSVIHTTPRRRKQPQPVPSPSNQELPEAGTPSHRPWPQLEGKCLSDEGALADAAEEIFGYRPRLDQLRAARKILEGNDVFVVTATGAGKSLIFALVAIAARLLGLQRVVIVICPLKALQMDQVRPLIVEK